MPFLPHGNLGGNDSGHRPEIRKIPLKAQK